MNGKMLFGIFAIFLLGAGAVFVSAEAENWEWKNRRAEYENFEGFGESRHAEGCQVKALLTDEMQEEFYQRMQEIRDSGLERREMRDLKIALKDEFGLEHHGNMRNARTEFGGRGRNRMHW